jgi:hypothetical protein
MSSKQQQNANRNARAAAREEAKEATEAARRDAELAAAHNKAGAKNLHYYTQIQGFPNPRMRKADRKSRKSNKKSRRATRKIRR